MLSIKFDQREGKKILTGDLVKMTWFILENNYFKFDSGTKQQVSGTVSETKFTPTYACICIDRVKKNFLEKEHLKPSDWLIYVLTIYSLSGLIEMINFISFF